MASRRILKKNVNYIAGELLAECVMIGKFIPGVDKEKTDNLMVSVLNMQDEFIKRISHTEPGNVKGFYKKFREDLNVQVDAIIKGLEQLH
jgi:hypothetical protein